MEFFAGAIPALISLSALAGGIVLHALVSVWGAHLPGDKVEQG